MIPNCKKIVITDSFPIGAVVEWWSDVIPEGWLKCNGQTLNKSDYPDLYDVIGDTYTETPSSTTFSLPKHDGRTPVGVDSNDSDFSTLGAMLGEKKHTLTVDEMPSHNHRANSLVDWHTQASSGLAGTDGAYWRVSVRETHNTGNNQPHNNIQPSITTHFIIKAKQCAVTAAEVVDNLDSEDAKGALSASQGKILNDKIENLQNSLLDMFYPIGSYYETSVADFNPNTAWGGTWVEDSKGRATIAAGECDDDEGKMYTLGQKIGASTNWITTSMIPKINISGTTETDGGHAHALATANGQGNNQWGYDFTYDNNSAGWNSGAFNLTNPDGKHYHNINLSIGKNNPSGFSIIQSSIVVKRWHRIG